MTQSHRTLSLPILSKLFCGVATAALVLGAVASSAAADPVSSLVVFGDSSSDLGTQGPDRRPTNLGQMWSERLAGTLRLPMTLAREVRLNAAGDGYELAKPGGSNYAVNGSTALSFDCCLSLGQQVDFFVEDHKRFRRDALVAIWLDRNDVETAFADGLPYSAAMFADAYVDQVKRIKVLGARNLVAIGWELDLIPAQFALDTGRATPETLALLREETLKQRAALFPQLQKQNVFLIDLDRLGDDILANPKKYGFTKTSDGYQAQGDPNPPPSQSLPNDGNVFTLDGHYTSAAQAVIADYILAQLRARDQYAGLLTQSALEQRTAKQTLADFRSAAASGWSVMAAPYAGRIDQQSDGQLDAALNQTFQGLAFAIRRGFANGFTLGGGLSLRQFDGEFAGTRGKAKGTAGLVTAFVVQPVGKGASLDAYAAYGATEYSEIDRRAGLGAVAQERAAGETSGRQSTAGVGVRVEHEGGGWALAARVGAEYERTTIAGYAERANVLSLTYGDSGFESALGRVDLEIARGGQHRWRPFFNMSATYDFLDDAIDVKVGPSPQSVVTYSSRRGLRTEVLGQLGVDVRLGGAWTLRTSLTESVWSGKGGDAHASTFALRVGRAF